MKSRPPLLARLWRKLFPAAPPAPSVRLSSTGRPLPKSDRLRDRGIEPLEGRIAPAVLLPNGVDLQYKDLDGDLVTIHFSKSIFTPTPGGTVDGVLADVFKFSTGSAHTGAPVDAQDGLQQLQTIDLTKVRPTASTTPATGVSFTVTAQKIGPNEGDGLVNVGAISASGIALGTITIGGDLGQIDAGVSSAAIAVKSLNVKTLGALTTTQAGTASYESLLVGGMDSFTADSIVGGYLHVTTSTISGAGTAAKGNIGTVTIAHQIKARDAAAASATNDGRLEAAGNIGTLSIGSGFRDAAHPQLSDGLFGGAGASSASIKVGGSVTKLVIKGDLRGAGGSGSASIDIDGQLPTLQVDGSLIGGGVFTPGTPASGTTPAVPDVTTGTSGATITAGKLGTVSIGVPGGHGLVAGLGAGSAVVRSDSTIGTVIISDIEGNGANSGGLTASGAIGSVTVNGYVKGGASSNSGFIHSDSGLGTVKLVGHLEGGAGARSGVVSSGGGITLFSGSGILGAGNAATGTGLDSGGVTAAGKITSVLLTESLIGGNGEHSGYIDSDFSFGSIVIKGNVEGRSGHKSGSITSGFDILTLNISGQVKGGDITVTPAAGTTPQFINPADLSGSITAGAAGQGSINTLTIGAGLLGGQGVASGVVSVANLIGTAKISRFDSQGNRLDAIVGGAGDSSGVLYSFDQINSVTVTGNILGGGGRFAGSIQAHVLKAMTVTGNVTGGTGDNSGAIRAYDYEFPNGEFLIGSLGTVNVTGAVAGGDGARSGAVSSDGSITSLTVGALNSGSIPTTGRLVAGAGYHGGSIGTLVIKQAGTAALHGGTVQVYGSVGKLSTGNLTHGMIYVQDTVGALNITGAVDHSTILAGGLGTYLGKADVAFGTVTITGTLNATTIAAGYGQLLEAQNEHARIGSVKVTGAWTSSNLIAGTIGTLSAAGITDAKIAATDSIGALTVAGQLTDTTISARGQAVFNGKTDLAIASVTVNGNVTNSTIKAGYGPINNALNGHAQIGAVKVTGNWIASNLVAGVQDAGAPGFGDAGDQIIPGNTSAVKARIASVAISGNVDTAGSGQSGFVAQEIGSFKSSRGTLPLTTVAGQWFDYAGTTGGTVSIREIVPPPPPVTS